MEALVGIGGVVFILALLGGLSRARGRSTPAHDCRRDETHPAL